MSSINRHNKNGFTLVELLVVMVIMSIVALTLVNFVADWLQSVTLAQARSNLLNGSESSMDTITTDVMLSGYAEQNNRWPDPNGPGGNQYGWSSNGQTLVLAKVATDSSNNIIFSDPAKYITQKDDIIYYVSGTTLYRRTIVSNSSNDSAVTTCPPAAATQTCPADKTIATGVSSFTLSYDDDNGQTSDTSSARSVQVGLTLTSLANGQPISASYSTRMVFRNE